MASMLLFSSDSGGSSKREVEWRCTTSYRLEFYKDQTRLFLIGEALLS